MSVNSCCLKGFAWDGKPTGHTSKLANYDTYVTGDISDVAVLFIHDLFGWTWLNTQLLADHFAREANAIVYVPDFFGGKSIDHGPIYDGELEKLDIKTFMEPNTREKREPEIFECARALRAKYKKVGAVGYCFGGWACFRLGAKEHQPPLVDCISIGHPTFLTKKDIDEVSVPVQVLAPEIDPVYPAELKSYTFETIMKLALPFDYRHFPGIEHGCFTRGNPGIAGDRQAMTQGKNASVHWFKEFLLELE